MRGRRFPGGRFGVNSGFLRVLGVVFCGLEVFWGSIFPLGSGGEEIGRCGSNRREPLFMRGSMDLRQSSRKCQKAVKWDEKGAFWVLKSELDAVRTRIFGGNFWGSVVAKLPTPAGRIAELCNFAAHAALCSREKTRDRHAKQWSRTVWGLERRRVYRQFSSRERRIEISGRGAVARCQSRKTLERRRAPSVQ